MRTTLSVSGVLLLAAVLGLGGCGPAKQPAQTGGEAAGAPTASAEASAAPTAEAGPEGSAAPSATPPDKDAPEISRSAGTEGGVVVFWPRVIPRTEDAATKELAGKLQKKLVELVTKAAPKRARDVRPDPERVCPKAGCVAPTVGVLLLAQGKACAAVALVSGPGTAPAKLVPWAGMMELKSAEVPFRDPPENAVTVRDMASCEKLMEQLSSGDAAVVKAIKELAGS